MENGHWNSECSYFLKNVIFRSYVNVYQRATISIMWLGNSGFVAPTASPFVTTPGWSSSLPPERQIDPTDGFMPKNPWLRRTFFRRISKFDLWSSYPHVVGMLGLAVQYQSRCGPIVALNQYLLEIPEAEVQEATHIHKLCHFWELHSSWAPTWPHTAICPE